MAEFQSRALVSNPHAPKQCLCYGDGLSPCPSGDFNPTLFSVPLKITTPSLPAT